MILEHAKKELVKRYKYLYENAYFILAPYMYEQENETETLIYLNINWLSNINSLFEEFLLSDKPMEESKLYKITEKNKYDSDYLEKVKKGLSLLAKKNQSFENEILKSKLSIVEVLEKVSNYIEEQSGDLRNKARKLYVLDEYYRIFRYQNNGEIYTSGKRLNLNDASSLSLVIPKHERTPFRDKKDVGIKNNSFITAIINAPCYEYNLSIFTEEEKQQIYLEYHDELPHDLEISCELEEEYIEDIDETRLCRPENTNPCGQHFAIKETEIFVNPDDELYRYYHLCPHCGYIVNIPKEILSKGVKKRIEARCSMDQKLFRKMFLYSELIGLDNSSTIGQIRILKK